MQKFLTIKNADFEKVIKPFTADGWKVIKTTRVNDSTSQYVLIKPDLTKKING